MNFPNVYIEKLEFFIRYFTQINKNYNIYCFVFINCLTFNIIQILYIGILQIPSESDVI